MQGKHTRTESEREKDLILISELLDQGLSQSKIALEVGVSRAQIQYDIKELETRWKEEQLQNIDEIKERQLRKLALVQKEAWAGWRKSKESKIKETSKTGTNAHGLISEETISEEERIPEAKFLDVITKCIKEENEIYGIKKVPEFNLTQNLVNIKVDMSPELAELIKENENTLIDYESE